MILDRKSGDTIKEVLSARWFTIDQSKFGKLAKTIKAGLTKSLKDEKVEDVVADAVSGANLDEKETSINSSKTSNSNSSNTNGIDISYTSEAQVVEDFSEAMEDAGDKSSKTATEVPKVSSEVKKVGKQSKASTIGIGVLNMALSSLAAFAISAAISGIAKLISMSKDAQEATEDFVDSFKESQSTLSDHKNTIDEIKDEYTELSKGISVNGKNLSLTSDEFDRYHEICNSIAEMYPDLVTGYDDQGNALLNLKTNIQDVTQAYKDEAAAAADAMLTRENITNVMDNLSYTTGTSTGSGWKDIFNSVKNDFISGWKNIGNIQKQIYSESSPLDRQQMLQDFLNTNDNDIREEISNALTESVGTNYAVASIFGLNAGNIEDTTDEELEAVREKVEAELSAITTEVDSSVKAFQDLVSSTFDSDTSLQLTDEEQNAIDSIVQNIDADMATAFKEEYGDNAAYILKDKIIDIIRNSGDDVNEAFKGWFNLDENTSLQTQVDYLNTIIQAFEDAGIEVPVTFVEQLDSLKDTKQRVIDYANGLLDTKEYSGSTNSTDALKYLQTTTSGIPIEKFIEDNKINEVGADKLLSLLKELNDVQAAEDAYLGTQKKTVSTLVSANTDQLDEFQESITKVSGYIENLNSYSLSNGDVVDILQELGIDPSTVDMSTESFKGLNEQLHNVAYDALTSIKETIGNPDDYDNPEAVQQFIDLLENLYETIDDASVKTAANNAIDFWTMRVQEFDDAITNVEAHIDNLTGSTAKNIAIGYEIKINETKGNDIKSAIGMYEQMAENELSKIPDDLKEAAKNGGISIESVSDDSVAQAIQNYREYSSSVSELNNELVTLVTTQKQLQMDQFNNISDEYGKKVDLIASDTDRLKSIQSLTSAKYDTESSELYDQMIDRTNIQLDYLRQEKQALQNNMDNAIANGLSAGDDNWYEMIDALSSVDDEILQCQSDILDFADSIKAIYVGNFTNISDNYSSQVDAIKSNIDTLQNLSDYQNATTGSTDRVYYDNMISNATTELSLLQEGKAQLQQAMSEALANGVEIGDSDWNTMKNSLDSINTSIIDCNSSLQEFKDSIKQLAVDKFSSIADNYGSQIDIVTSQIDKIQSLSDAQKSKTGGTSSKYYDEMLSYTREEIGLLMRERSNLQEQMAQAVSDGVTVGDEDWVSMTSQLDELNGSIVNCESSLVELNNALLELQIDRFNAVADNYSNQIDLITDANDKLQSIANYNEDNGGSTEAIYEQLKNNTTKQIDILNQEKKDLTQKLNEAIANGIEVGSDDWYTMYSAIQDVDGSILDATINLDDFQDTLNELSWDNLEKITSQFDHIKNGLESILSIVGELPTNIFSAATDSQIESTWYTNEYQKALKAYQEAQSNNSMTDEIEEAYNIAFKHISDAAAKTGKSLSDYMNSAVNATGNLWTVEGITQLGMYSQEYELAKVNIERYSDAIDELKTAYANGEYTLEAYTEKFNELTESQWSEAEAANTAKQAIISLVNDAMQDQIDAYSKLIDVKKSALQADEDLYEYEKNLANQQKEVAKIQEEIDARSGDTSKENIAKLDQLYKELTDAQDSLDDTVRDHSISEQETAMDDSLTQLQNDMAEYLLNTDQVLSDAMNTTKNYATDVYSVINGLVKDMGLTIDDSIMQSWANGSNAIAGYSETLTASSSTFISLLQNVQSNIEANRKSVEALTNDFLSAFDIAPITTLNTNLDSIKSHLVTDSDAADALADQLLSTYTVPSAQIETNLNNIVLGLSNDTNSAKSFADQLILSYGVDANTLNTNLSNIQIGLGHNKDAANVFGTSLADAYGVPGADTLNENLANIKTNLDNSKTSAEALGSTFENVFKGVGTNIDTLCTKLTTLVDALNKAKSNAAEQVSTPSVSQLLGQNDVKTVHEISTQEFPHTVSIDTHGYTVVASDGTVLTEGKGYNSTDTAKAAGNAYKDKMAALMPNSRYKDAKVQVYAKGGMVGKEKSIFDLLAQQMGEDHMVAAREGERILTADQNSAYESLLSLAPDITSAFTASDFTPDYSSAVVSSSPSVSVDMNYENLITVNGSVDASFANTFNSLVEEAGNKLKKNLYNEAKNLGMHKTIKR